MLEEISDDSIEQFLLNSDKPVLVEFSTTWCHPCKILQQVINSILPLYKGKLVFAKYDCEKGSIWGKRYNIKAYPTIMIFKEGEPLASKVGGKLDKAAITAFIDSSII